MRNRHSIAFFYAPSLTARHMSEMFERSYGYAPAT